MAATGAGDNKPWVVVLGGCGFIGRNLVEYLIDEDLVEGIRVVDKVPPQMAWLNKRHSQTFSDPRVEFVSANLINPASCVTALRPRVDLSTWDLVVNCAGETKLGQSDSVYREGILTLSLNCARECARLKVQRFIEISSACVYTNNKRFEKVHKEDNPTEPWTVIAKWKLRVEEELRELANETGLQYSVLRPVIVYGKGDLRNLTPRLLVASLYTHGEYLTLMWSSKLGMGTVNVRDLCAAVWLVGRKEECQGQVYNVVDQGNSTQGSIINIVASIFKIKYDYIGIPMTLLTNNDLSSVLEDLNDKHLGAWAAACRTEGIENTPLDPTMTEDMLSGNALTADGSKLKSLGFSHQHPVLTVDKLKEVIDDFVEMGVFPRCLLQN